MTYASPYLRLAETGRVRQQQRGDWYVRMFGRQQVQLYRLRGHFSATPPCSAVASDGLLRVSEVAALDVGDVQAEANGSGRLFVGESKTDQEGRGVVLYLGALTVSRVNAWLAAAGHQDGPLFRRVRVGGGRNENAIIARQPAGPRRVRLVARNRWQPAGPRLSRCRRRAGGSHRRCRATMHGASWQHGAPSLASVTVADKSRGRRIASRLRAPFRGCRSGRRAPDGVCPFEQVPTITRARARVNRSFLWLSRMVFGVVTVVTSL